MMKTLLAFAVLMLSACGGGAAPESAPPGSAPAPVAASQAFIRSANYSPPGGGALVIGTFELTDATITFSVDGGNVQSINRADVTGVALGATQVTIATARSNFSIGLLKPDGSPDIGGTFAVADLLALACVRGNPACVVS